MVPGGGVRGASIGEGRRLCAAGVGTPGTAVLSERDREVLRLRFEQDLTQSEIGARLGCSQMHVSRIRRGAIARLQAHAAAELAAAA